MTREYLQRLYGDRVRVQYDDVADLQAFERHKARLAKAASGYRIYPLVFINDDLVSAGNAEPYQVLRQVQRYLEVTGQD